jgi:hypothetical protein
LRLKIAQEYDSKRDLVVSYLTSERAPRKRPPGSHWKKLRARLHRDPAENDRLVREFWSLLDTGWYWIQGDEREAENRRRATAALPSGRLARALDADWTKWAGDGLSYFPPELRDAVLRKRVDEVPFEAANGTEMRAVITVHDHIVDERGRSKLSPGSGRREERDTASEELMKFLIGIGLQAGVAARITADANRWFWGRILTPAALRKTWQRRTSL